MFIWIVASICAFFVKGLCGFANTLVFSSIASLTANNIFVSPVELLLGYPTNLIIAFKERDSIDLKICVPISLFVLIGSISGIFLLKNTDARIVKLCFGIVIVAVGFEMQFGKREFSKPSGGKALLYFVGVLSGILCGLYGVGALLGAYVGKIAESTKEFKANICMVFFVENSFRIVLYSLFGIIDVSIVKQAVQLIPFMFLGLFAGIKCSGAIEERVVKRIVILMMFVSGLYLIFTNFWFF